MLAAAVLSGCASRARVPDVPGDLDTDRLCGIVAAAVRGDPAARSEIARQFRVEPKRLRWDGNGVWVPQTAAFIEERGFFLARPGVVPRDGYPSFTPVRQCLYRYRTIG
jgi:hypothetical protein